MDDIEKHFGCTGSCEIKNGMLRDECCGTVGEVSGHSPGLSPGCCASDLLPATVLGRQQRLAQGFESLPWRDLDGVPGSDP